MSPNTTERHDAGGGAGGDTVVLSRSTLMTVRRVLHAFREGTSAAEARELLSRLVTLRIHAYHEPAPPRRLAAAPVGPRPAGARSAA
jgi:hypothetical protein